MRIENLDHIQVVFDAVQSNPRQKIPIGQEILIVGLMLMPEKGKLQNRAATFCRLFGRHRQWPFGLRSVIDLGQGPTGSGQFERILELIFDRFEGLGGLLFVPGLSEILPGL